MALYIQELIEQEDCSDFMVKVRKQAVRQALRRYKNGKSNPEEKAALIHGMKIYRTMAANEKARTYNELLCFYFAQKPLDTLQISERFKINRRTLFKDIDRGIEDLTVILYGVGGVELMPDEESPAFIKDKLRETITKQLTEELERR